MPSTTDHRCGFVAIVGLPNAGKSTLLNTVLGQKVSIVTPKPQTTRNRIVGIRNVPGAQIILLDTPGLHSGPSELGRRMLKGAKTAMGEADVVVYVHDAARGGSDLPHAGRIIASVGRPVVVALNKIDRVRPKDLLLPVIDAWSKVPGVEVVVPISAKTGDGIEPLLREALERLPEGEALYPSEMVTDRAERFLAAELVREQATLRLRKEVPYAIAVAVDEWAEKEGGCVIRATIHVEKESQKGILIGAGGKMVKQIGQSARAEIERLLGCPVHLFLTVEVSEGWRGDPAALGKLGYDE